MSEAPTAIEERVYVGNVDFSATEDELKEFFSDFKVASVEIPSKTITRGKKSFVKRLGFGFVQFETKDDADRAIEAFNGKEFKSRHIYAKKALPPATEEEKKKKTEAYFAKQKELKAARTERNKKDATKSETANGDSSNESGATGAANSGKAGAKSTPNGEDKLTGKLASGLKTPDGNKSKDTVFIANLDYKANVKQLNLLFKELKPKWIHVPSRKVPYHVLKRYQAKQRPIFNKGIAFVKFPSEELQLKAIEEFNGHEINGRVVVVEAAVDRAIPDVENASDASESASEASPAADVAADDAAEAAATETVTE